MLNIAAICKYKASRRDTTEERYDPFGEKQEVVTGEETTLHITALGGEIFYLHGQHADAALRVIQG